MTPSEALMNDHELILRMLDALEKGADRADNGHHVRPGFFLDAADFITDFADGCHHRKEEGVYFEEMAASGLPPHAGPIGVMRREHDIARGHTRALRAAAERLVKGDAAASADAVSSARAYVSLMREHIMKEDAVLFPIGDRLFSPAAQASILERFARINLEARGASYGDAPEVIVERLEAEARSAAA